MQSSNRNIFRVTDHLCGELIGHRWIPLTKAIDAELWFFYFDLRPNKRLSKQSCGWWFETPLRSLWRHRNANFGYISDQFLTHRSPDKMTTISRMTLSSAFPWMKNLVSLFKYHCWRFVPKGPTDNKSALVQIMAWSRTGDKSLRVPVLSTRGGGGGGTLFECCHHMRN